MDTGSFYPGGVPGCFLVGFSRRLHPTDVLQLHKEVRFAPLGAAGPRERGVGTEELGPSPGLREHVRSCPLAPSHVPTYLWSEHSQWIKR